MRIRVIVTLSILVTILIPSGLMGQISRGGLPIRISKQKSIAVDDDVVVMPAVDNQQLRNSNNQPDDLRLKPFRFAYTFDVDLTTKNSGNWQTIGNVNVWRLKIRSVTAYSLNLILDRYKLPENARLFIINEETGEIKGSYTSTNNTASQVLAIEPIEGDELIVQYEEPIKAAFPGEFRIIKVSHDFIGITRDGVHRPLGSSGACNVNINCDIANGNEKMREAVCRIIIEGREICTGALINNTGDTGIDGIPYLLTACHCIDSEAKAEATIFLFNYESPYCSTYNSPSIDGDVSHSLSGSSLKSSFDSIDFALVRLNTVPPYYFRPYLLGWNRLNVAPTSTTSIHHPLGDIKKVAIDLNAPVTASFSLSSGYMTNGFWNVRTWEYGVTESGSSGAPFLDQDKYLVGTLTGGSASCTSRKNDYFEKFFLAWDYRSEPEKQLKAWLDPINSVAQKLKGRYLYIDSIQLCRPITHFKNDDTHTLINITSGVTNKGYWSGTNTAGYTDFAEKFIVSSTSDIKKNCEIHGISIGIGKLKIVSTDKNIEIQVYSGKDKPETLLYSEQFALKNLYADAMNYFAFKTPVKTVGNFFVAYNLSQLEPGDTLAVYMANRKSDKTNSFYIKNQNVWTDYIAHNTYGNGSALLCELIVCNIDDPDGIEEFKTDLPEARFYPNPMNGTNLLNIQTNAPIDFQKEITVYDLLGKKQNIPYSIDGQNHLTLNFSGKIPGIYLVNLEAGDKVVVGKIAYLP
jgi:lysyl endopeptidase